MVLLIIVRLLEIYDFIILLRCICSFIFTGTYNSFYMFLVKITEPVLSPVRNLLSRTPLGNLPLDFSPVIVMLLIGVLERWVYLLSKMF